MDVFNKKKVAELSAKVADMQNAIDILTATELRSTGYTGTRYKEPATATKELAKKYEGLADWGVQQVRNIIDLRAAFTIGSGITVTLKKGKEAKTRELEFIQDFIKYNDRDNEMAQDFAKEAEIDGRVLCHLSPSSDNQNIDLRFVSYTANDYTVTAAANDYNKYTSVKYKTSGGEGTYSEEEFVYSKFSGRVHKVNEIMSKTAMVLTAIEDLDKALYDWRAINRLFASPTPYFECQSPEDAESMYSMLKKIRWNIGKFLCGVGKFSLVSMPGEGVESLEKEIITKSKIISGATGVPVHFMGFPELMSNRSTSTDLFELISASTSKERRIWAGTYDEIFSKALAMANKTMKKNFDTDAIKTEIPHVTAEKLKEIIDVWLPLFESSVIDHDTMLQKIPQVDAQMVKKNIAAQAKERLQSMRDMMGDNEGDDAE